MPFPVRAATSPYRQEPRHRLSGLRAVQQGQANRPAPVAAGVAHRGEEHDLRRRQTEERAVSDEIIRGTLFVAREFFGGEGGDL